MEFEQEELIEELELEEEEEFTPEEVEETLTFWRETYGDVFIFQLKEDYLTCRLITTREYDTLFNQYEDKFDLEEAICQLCVLDPIVDWQDDIYAGYATSLARAILEKSMIILDPDQPYDLLSLINKKYDDVSESLNEQMPLVIKHCFNEFTLLDIYAMPMPQQIELFVRAKWMLKNLESINLDYEEEKDAPLE